MADKYGKIHEQIAGAIDGVEVMEDAFLPAIRVPAAEVEAIALRLRDEFGFSHLSNLTAIDYPEEEKLDVVYHLYSFTDSRKLLMKAAVGRKKPQLPSVFSVWPTADWQEREAFDLLGVIFTGHPNLVRVLMPDDFKGHPLQKDFEMKGGRKA